MIKLEVSQDTFDELAALDELLFRVRGGAKNPTISTRSDNTITIGSTMFVLRAGSDDKENGE